MNTVMERKDALLSNDSFNVKPNDLINLFDKFSSKIKVLSLDCFDTLIWRKKYTPKDVFFDLQNKTTFKSLGITAINRIDAESSARGLMLTEKGHGEVKLYDIYKRGFPSLTEEEISSLIQEEMAAEIEACYAFEPILNLIRYAITHHVRVIIVSNTYLKKEELSYLLSKKLPTDVLSGISDIFCSCEYQQSKTGLLFEEVMSKLQEPANKILHIGDNSETDFISPRLKQIQAFQLIQFDQKTTEYLRLQSTALVIADPDIHRSRSMSQLFRGIFSCSNVDFKQAHNIIGYMSLGPIMYTFSRYLHDEIEKIKKEKKSCKVLFLLRDAYLPFQCFEKLFNTSPGTLARISRFTGIACSFRTKENISTYITGISDPQRIPYACKQLLLDEKTSNIIIDKANQSSDPISSFYQIILEETISSQIINQSKKYFSRFVKYLEKTADIKKNETIIFVDLGYVGRTQTYLTDVLKNEMNIDIIGRYLISLNSSQWQLSRSGLVNPEWCDDRTIQALSQGNLLLEELTCSQDNSVVDYSENGDPIFSNSSATNSQHNKSKLIHSACLQFIDDANIFFSSHQISFSLQELRDTVVAELMRRTFFPLPEEIEYLDGFFHDENCGTDLAGQTFSNPLIELASLKKHGLWFKNQNPYGLRYCGLELPMILLTQARSGFETSLSDLTMRQEQVLVIISKNNEMIKKLTPAYHTYDGYFSLCFSIENASSQLAILFGLKYKSMQIEHVELIEKEYFYALEEEYKTINIKDKIHLNNITEKESNYFECLSESAAVLIGIEKSLLHNKEYILRIVFRPIINRDTKAK